MIVRALDETEFLAAGARWDALLARSRADSFFLRHAWLSAWWRRFGGARKLAVLELLCADETVGFAPLCISKKSAHGLLPLREVGFLGREKVTGDYLDLIAAPGMEEEILDATLGHLLERRGEWDLLRLSDLPEGCATAMRLARLADARALTLAPVPGQTCPYLPLPTSWEAFLQKSCSANLRSNLRRREKKLAGMGARFVDRSREGTADALEALFALHGARWSEMKGRTGNFVDDRVRAFHQELAPTLAREGALGLWTVEVGDRAVAAIYGFKHRGKFLYYQAGFDPTWADHGVGLALMGHAIKRCIEGGIGEFDYLRGEEDYKRRWTNQSRRTVAFAVLPPGLKAFAWRALGATKDAAKRLLRREAPAPAPATVETVAG